MIVFQKLGRIFKRKQLSWKEIEYFDPRWKLRIEQMASLIPTKSKSIMDLGCGKMWLKDYLSNNCEYVPVDYIDRGEYTIICDFNRGEFPTIFVDTAFVSGCLEYINDYKSFIQSITYSSNHCILSYCSINYIPSLKRRNKQNWVNNLSEEQIIRLFAKQNFKLIRLISQENSIFYFKKEKLTS